MNEQSHSFNGFTQRRKAYRLAMAALTALFLQIAGNTEANAANPFTEGVEAYGAQNYNLALAKPWRNAKTQMKIAFHCTEAPAAT